jgi:hypothetical protein
MSYLIFIAIIAIALLFLYIRKRNTLTMDCIQDDNAKGKRIINATQMSENEIKDAINGFIKLYEENGDKVDRPQVTQLEENTFMLRLPDTTPYDLFCYWVNYLVYSNEKKKYNNNITGWYEVSANAKLFPSKTLMIYVPETDTEHDNVYVTTKDNLCYKQEFAGDTALIPQEYVYRKYSAIPFNAASF